MPLSPPQTDLAALIEQTASLAPVTPAAAAAYESRKIELVRRVDSAMAADPHIVELIGANPLRAMFENHAHHAEFMSNVFKLGDYRLLVRTVPWVYHSYTSRGFSPDYFPPELHAWSQAVRHELGAAHAPHIVPVYEWLLAHHEDFVALAKGMRAEPAPPSPRWQTVRDSFLAALLVGDHRTCQSIAAAEVGSVEDLRDLYLEVLQPCLYEVGDMWQRGEISIADEHMASAVVARVMASQYPRFVELEQTKGRIILSSAPNEFHDIGGRMMADLLEIDGWDVTYLGANTPIDDLIDMTLRLRPHILGLSVAMPFNIDRTAQAVARLRREPSISGTYVLVGGRVFLDEPGLQDRVGADAWARDVQQGVDLARDWWEAHTVPGKDEPSHDEVKRGAGTH